jgi:alanyl-tRNA synthetase
MNPTTRLYFTDSGLLQFDAIVLATRSTPNGAAVILDRSAFYPTGGGQPNDTGELAGVRVLDVFEDDAGLIHHIVADASNISPGQTVHGRVDRERRYDHLQQHSGQHILSQAFVQAFGAATRSFHLGAETSTIDIELESPSWDAMKAAENIANAVIFDNRPMRVHLVDETEAAKLPLRKESAVQGEIRVIEIQDFDWSPCGGTHASAAGQIGLIAIKSFERAKRMTRVEFVCGFRALREYQTVREITRSAAEQLSAARETVPELISRAAQENKTLNKRIRELSEIASRVEAQELLAEASSFGNYKLVKAVFTDRAADELRQLAAKIVEAEPSIALLASRSAAAARLVFARSSSLSHDMGQLMSRACQMLGGRGGGKTDLAQGGGPDVSNIDVALNSTVSKLS